MKTTDTTKVSDSDDIIAEWHAHAARRAAAVAAYDAHAALRRAEWVAYIATDAVERVRFRRGWMG